MDRCLDFNAFTHDRSALLDRYAAEYGPGWLWYEPPLSSAGNGGDSGNGNRAMRGPAAIARKGFCLESKLSWRQGTENMGHYNIRMGFRRRKANVTRPTANLKQAILHGNGHRSNGEGHAHSRTSPTNPPKGHHNLRMITDPMKPSSPISPTISTHIPTIPQPDTSKPGGTVPDPDGPRILYNMLLDSGATLPTLFAGDLPKLGIDPVRYSAQSARRVNTADSTLVTRVYELDVRVFGAGDQRDLKGGEVVTTAVDNHGSNGGNKIKNKSKNDNSNNNSNNHGSGRAPLRHQQQKSQPKTSKLASSSSPLSPSPPGKEETTSLSLTIPVLIFPGNSKDFGEGDDTVPDRLSGLLPFHVCYLSGAAGSFKLWMGEERRDVLGAGRLPGHMRYGEILNNINANGGSGMSSVHRPSKRLPVATAIQLERWRSECLKTPDRVVFEHELDSDAENGVLRDEDTVDGNIIMRAPQGGLGFDNPSRSFRSDGIQVVDLRRKRRRIYQDAESHASVVKKPQTKKKGGRAAGRHGSPSFAN